MRWAPLTLAITLLSCTRAPAPPPPSLVSMPVALTAPDPAPATVSPVDAFVATRRPSQIDPDGNDDPEDPGTGTVPTAGHFERVGRAPLSLQRICDLTPFHDALYASHANVPIGTDGATISRYAPVASDDPARKRQSPFTVAFDWNRPGEPAKGGGAGQGFLRVRTIDGRLFVPDTDPPYNGFGISEGGPLRLGRRREVREGGRRAPSSAGHSFTGWSRADASLVRGWRQALLDHARPPRRRRRAPRLGRR